MIVFLNASELVAPQLQREKLSESFARGVQTLDEATHSAMTMAQTLLDKGLLLSSPKDS